VSRRRCKRLRAASRLIDEALLNRVELTGVLIERKALRFTPAGVPVVECLIGHQSEQLEAGSPRRVECEIQAIALGSTAQWLQAATRRCCN
jgi:primosomal replication protein N